MGWELIAVANHKKPCESAFEPMGSVADVARTIDRSFAGVRWDGDTFGSLLAPDFGIEFDLQLDDQTSQVSFVMIEIRGASCPVAALDGWVASTGWHLYDTIADDWYRSSDSQESWHEFTQYRGRIASKRPDDN